MAALILAAAPAAFAAPLYPDLVSDPPESPEAEPFVSGGTSMLLLRFDGFIHNIGPGRADIRASNSGDPFTLDVVKQRIFDSVSGFTDVTAPAEAQVLFESTDGHRHYHLKVAARYSLWDAGLTAEVAP